MLMLMPSAADGLDPHSAILSMSLMPWIWLCDGPLQRHGNKGAQLDSLCATAMGHGRLSPVHEQHTGSPMLRVPKKQFKFKKPDFWRADGGDYASHPGRDVDIIIISNEAGLQYVKPDLLISRLREASLAVGGHALTTKLPQKSYSSYSPYEPFLRPFRKLEVHAKEVRPWASTSGQTSFAKYIKARPKWHNARAIWYTDGSAKKY